jgi:hypothetical protein
MELSLHVVALPLPRLEKVDHGLREDSIREQLLRNLDDPWGWQLRCVILRGALVWAAWFE